MNMVKIDHDDANVGPILGVRPLATCLDTKYGDLYGIPA